jgi:signal transduction histidine kinase
MPAPTPPSDNRPSGDDAPVLRRATPASATDRPQGGDASFVANRLTALAHELSNLLDGSMRCLRQARDTLAPDRAPAPVDPSPSRRVEPAGRAVAPVGPDMPSGLARRLDTVYRAMEQMAGLVRSTMAGLTPGTFLGARRGLVEDWSLADAIEHAAEVMRPLAAEHGIVVEVSVDARLSSASAGSVYAILTAGIRNAIESIRLVERREAGGGLVRIEGRMDDGPGEAPTGHAGNTRWARIDIADDGVGPPTLPQGEEGRVMEYGFTTKATGLGIGLAVAADLIADLGGRIDLLPRPSAAGGTRLAGAVLRIRFPVRGRRP